MNSDFLLKKIEMLSNDERKEVFDFIDFLVGKNRRLKRGKKSSSGKIEKEKFIGIWKNRDEMQNSSAWVKNMRKNEWSN